MASILQNAAVSAVAKGLPSSYYTRDDRPNPVFQALDQEINLFLNQFKKDGASKQGEDSKKKLAGSLFEIWNKYEPRLPVKYFKEKLIEIGDFLLNIKEYRLALWQCYDWYLRGFTNVHIEDNVDVDTFKNTYLPDGLKAEDASLTFRALLGRSICIFHLTTMSDPRLVKKQSLDRCLQVLTFLRLVTQVMLPRETLCWLVYNGTIHIYTIARYLMPLGYSAKVLEFLLWASMTLESSVPLMTIKYLGWRTTLYAAVCQCYYDCKADEQAEKFAKRGLLKINEISQLETLSCHKNTTSKEINLRAATLRMALMVFKRSVFESRRKPKGVFRPKSGSNLKEVINLPWPRTPTEKLLSELFDGGSAQFLAILESLSNSNQRIFHPAPPAPDSEPEILDVYSELMLAAQEILAGGAGNNETGAKAQMLVGNSPMSAVVDKGSLLEISTGGGESIPLGSVIRLLKLAYSYEHFDVFEILLGPVLEKIKEYNERDFKGDEKVLQLLSAMSKLLSRKGKKQNVDDESLKTGLKPSSASVRSVIMGDELLHVADCLSNIFYGQIEKDKVDLDIVVDAVLFLWNKCKAVFQKYQTGSVDNIKYLQKMDNTVKLKFSKTNLIFDEAEISSFSNVELNTGWTYLLEVVHQGITWSNISQVDPVLTAEVVLRLAMVYETTAQLDILDEKAMKESRTTLTDILDTPSESVQPISASNQTLSGLKRSNRELLIQAREVLEVGLKNLSFAAQAVAIDDGESLADVPWIKELNPPEAFSSRSDDDKDSDRSQSKVSKKVVWNTVKDLFLELTLMYHRVCLKLSAPRSGKVIGSAAKNKGQVKEPNEDKDFDDLSQQCNKNLLSKALLYAQRAVQLAGDQSATQEQGKLLQEAVDLVQRVQKEEKKIYLESTLVKEVATKPTKVPPPPILLYRTATCMEFKPALFVPESGEKVAYYSIFARSASGPNVKARLSDYNFAGTGDKIPSLQYKLKVSHLQPNERYMFAVAAYTDKGKLIGDGIGASTRPLLASQPLSILMCWACIGQMAYQVGCFEIARQVCNVLWDHFVVKPESEASEIFITQREQDFKLTLLRLNQKSVQFASPVLLRQFLTTIFIQTDMAIKEGQLFCDTVCERGPLSHSQLCRLKLCENMLVAIELAGWLNESNLALQASVQIYGLLAPMLFHKIPSLAVIQILQRCHAVFQEVPTSLILRRHGITGDGLNHMIACITFRLSKTLRSWGQNALADTILEDGKRLLKTEAEAKTAEGKIDDQQGVKIQASAKKISEKFEIENEELRALEVHITSLHKASASEMELSGNENPSILHSYISYMPCAQAFKEVSKFKKRQRYLEFLVQVAQKGLDEGMTDEVLNWCEDGLQWINKRNETFIGPRPYMDKQPGAVIGLGDDPKKFAAAMVEYGKKKDESAKKPQPVVKKPKYKPMGSGLGISELNKNKQEEIERALDKLTLHFLTAYRAYQKRKKFQNVCSEEQPWKSQLHLIKGLSQLNTLLVKQSKKEKIQGWTTDIIHRTDVLDQEWFTLETAGVIIIGREGVNTEQGEGRLSPLRKSLQEVPSKEKSAVTVNAQITGIEIAASVITGAEIRSPSPVTFVDDTPRTYRSDKPNINVDSLNTTAYSDTLEGLKKTFTSFRRAMVLAHRGQHWILLQNAARSMWDCTTTALLRLCSTELLRRESGAVKPDVLRSICWHTFYVAADCLLEMMAALQGSMENRAARAKSKMKPSGKMFTSWAGDIKSEYGGASLSFDPLLDDTNKVDLRWVRRLVLRTLELLYLEEKWEKLVDIGMRFCVLTNNRYAEQVIPLIIQAQRFLEDQIKAAGGPNPPQPHFKSLQSELGHVIEFKEYLKLQLKVVTKKSKLVAIQPGAQIDPIGHGTYTKNDALRLSCVPLDVEVSLKTLRETLSQSHHTARALQHSRKLLCLYLAGLQQAQDSAFRFEATHVDFKLAAGQPQSPMPPDESQWGVSNAGDILVTPIGRSQLGTVISSYEKTIELLNAKNQKGIAAQAMHELGNIYFHLKNTKAAFKWWCQALDRILNMNDSLHTWRQLQTDVDISLTLLDRCGLWGCVLAAVLTSNIAQYILTVDLGLRIESCLLSGYLFKALFRASMPHPASDRDYAMYNIGQNCEVKELVPGIDFMTDRFRCDGRQMVAALKYVIEELSRSQHNLFVLPLLSLYQYFTTSVCHDLQRSVDCRILRLQVLTDLKLFSEAVALLQQLMNGDNLPLNLATVTNEKPAGFSKFATSKQISDPQNLKVLSSLLDMRLSTSLSALYGPHLTCYLSLAQAHLFIIIGSTIPVLPKTDEMTLSHRQEKVFTKAYNKTSIVSVTNLKTQLKPAQDDSDPKGSRLPSQYESVSFEDIKGSLLSSADQIVTGLANVIIEFAEKDKQGVEGLASAELELLIKCQLEQSHMARQKHHAPLAARKALSILKLIQKAAIFQPRKPQPIPPRSTNERPSSMKGGHIKSARKYSEAKSAEQEFSKFQYLNLLARSRLDPKLWLLCRLELVNSLLLEIRGLGEVKDPNNKAISNLADCRQYCAEGISEAEVFGDKEMQAQFYFKCTELNIIEGKNLDHTISLLENALSLLQELPHLSIEGRILLSTCLVLKADLEASFMKEFNFDLYLKKVFNSYLDAQKLLLKELELLGEKVEHYYPEGQLDHHSSPAHPLQNVFFSHIHQLAKVKLRIGHAMTRIAVHKIKSGKHTQDPVFTWTECLGVLETALQLSQISASRDAATEAEILLMIGRCQKMLVYLGKFEPSTAAIAFLEAIKTSYFNDHDLGLMRQAYLELGLLHMNGAGLISVSEGSFLEKVNKPVDGDITLKKQQSRTSSARSNKSYTEEFEYRRAAFLAIRGACIAANAQRLRHLLPGNPKIAILISDKAETIPEFLSLDLLSGYVLGRKKQVFKNEIEEELSTMFENQETKVVETYEDQVNRAKAESKDLSWQHLLGYQSILQRLMHTSTLSLYNSREKTEAGKKDSRTEKDAEKQLLTSSPQVTTGINYNVVRYIINSEIWSLRLTQLHKCLATNLRIYASDCSGPFPPVNLSQPPSGASELNIRVKHYGPLTLNKDYSYPPSGSALQLPPGSNSNVYRPSDKTSEIGVDMEVSMQWFYPSMTEVCPSSACDAQILLMYSLVRKGSFSQSPDPGVVWVPLQKVKELHEKLVLLEQKAEIVLDDLPRDGLSSSGQNQSKRRTSQRAKTLSPKPSKVEDLESLLKECINDCSALFNKMPKDETAQEIPFEVSKLNIKSFQNAFDTSLGVTVKASDISLWLMNVIQ